MRTHTRRSPGVELDIERHALWTGLICSVLGLGVGLLLFSGEQPALYGGLSVGSVAAVAGGTAAAGSSAWGYKYLLVRREPWLARLPVWRWLLTSFSLILVHAAIAVMGLSVFFHLMQRSFLGLRLDLFAGSALVAVATGVSAYIAMEATARTTAQTLSVVLGGFMVAGIMLSMLVAEDPVWWQTMFSTLGTFDSGVLSFWTFNTTLLVTGLVLATFSEFLLRDLVQLARAHARRATARGQKRSRIFRPRPRVVRGCLLVVAGGVMLAAVVPVNTLGDLHASGVWLAAGALIILLGGSVFLFPGFPVIFHLLSLSALGGMWLALLLWLEWDYFNLTGFELAAVAILFGWISAFIRTTAAMLDVVEEKMEAEEQVAAARQAQRQAEGL
ncbi:hypothetical protein OK351_08260 [Glutamicibacter sp. MNS18]|uniref:hypothetical protein n=1 Tax=Glutamicibacter sp. MNS18 TaxID=2989817 RepID=UPI002236650C|nr:hypothetical protein [Glutamicibacter sp. MNS18]MCW4465494.1 hypothetical protein [Glutamicibacter sp. MNS18]